MTTWLRLISLDFEFLTFRNGSNCVSLKTNDQRNCYHWREKRQRRLHQKASVKRRLVTLRWLPTREKKNSESKTATVPNTGKASGINIEEKLGAGILIQLAAHSSPLWSQTLFFLWTHQLRWERDCCVGDIIPTLTRALSLSFYYSRWLVEP